MIMKNGNTSSDSIGNNVEDEKINLVAVVGPTAVGKTKLSIELAKKINGEIVNADSMQVYKNLNIGVAKPRKIELGNIAYHLIDIVECDQCFNLCDYLVLAKEKIKNIHQRGKIPILVGGTGLYIDSVVNNVNLNVVPQDLNLRKKLEEECEELGLEFLWNELFKVDVASASKIPPNNKKKLIRALEINYLAGKPLAQVYSDAQETKNIYNTVFLGLNYKNRQSLYEKINCRVDEMVCEGLVDEVARLFEKGLGKTAIQAIGYKEFEGYFDNTKTLLETVEKIKQNTRKYAKRQMTWFKKNKAITWINIDDYKNFDEIVNFCLRILEKWNYI